ncbi:MAG: FapA family protein [Treponema sp.]|nr:FapA family protein [Spirochaetia bacterium]MDD7534767.1 FapA family protein [Treponema sp.]MDY3721437.1 FapA family protein [Treponema sp.]MDY5757728.1 FapA family protein [Treponema sp.]MDY5817768.1 FapA family protein [Treponema sp.]
MVTLEKLREDMNTLLQVDKNLHFVEVNADTIDEALADAVVQLDTKLANLHYEVVEKGSDGILGLGKKPWKIMVYQDPSTIKKSTKLTSEGLFDTDEETETAKITNRDGLFYVRHFKSDIMLKIILPLGEGIPVEVKDVLDEIKRPDTISFDEELVKKCVKSGTDNDYCVVGQFKHVPAGDVVIGVEVTKDEMTGSIVVSPPSMSGSEASFDMIKRAILQQGIVEACIEEDKIKEFVDTPVYDVPFEVAKAIMPVDGHDAYISYNFETDPKKLRAQVDEEGNVDYKKLNNIQNVIADQPLAQKIPAQRGKGGKTLFGRYLEAKNGKDIQIQLGANVKLDRDGVTIKAEIDGEVMLVNGKVTVEPIKYLDAVNVKTGDVKFVGTVVIKGNVQEGYKVEATNIEVNGIVDKSRLEATGNIIVRQGIFGKGEGFIKAGKSLWAKFINDTTVEVEENVIVSDSIVNSTVTAMKNIVLRGKKAQIIGGHLMATEEICARKVGSPGGGTETILEVGVDPRAKKRLEELQNQQAKSTKEYENCDLDIQTLEQQKKLRKKLPQEKEEKLKTLKERCEQISEELEVMTDEINKIQEHLRDLKAIGKVKVEGDVYAGVKIYIRDVLDEVKIDTKSVTFFYDKAFSKRGPYEPPSLAEEQPDGYSAD